MAQRERRDGSADHVAHSSQGRHTGVGRWVLAMLLVAGVSACSRTGRGASGPDVERQSESEYDVARDLFMRGRDPRGALAHAEKAIELNDQNAEAHHFVALIYLNFCSVSPLECRLPEAEKSHRFQEIAGI